MIAFQLRPASCERVPKLRVIATARRTCVLTYGALVVADARLVYDCGDFIEVLPVIELLIILFNKVL